MGISPVFTQHKPEHVHVHTGRGRFLPSRSRGSWIPAEHCPSPELPPGLRKQRGGTPRAPAVRHQDEMGFKVSPTQSTLIPVLWFPLWLCVHWNHWGHQPLWDRWDHWDLWDHWGHWDN